MLRYFVILFLSFATPVIFMPSHVFADDTLNLRDKIIDFSKSANQKRWKIEDQIIQRERRFQDDLQLEYRETEMKNLDRVKDAAVWKAAKRVYHDEMRDALTLLRQKIRLHRAEFDLTYLASVNDLEKDMKEFFTPLEDRFRGNKDVAFQKAEADFQTSRDELRENLQKWKDRVKEMKTADSFFSF